MTAKTRPRRYCRGIIIAPSHAKLKVQYPPHGITAHAWGGPICSHMYIPLFSQRSTGHTS